MQHFYDGVIRKYITQTIRVFSEFTVRYGDGTLIRVPVAYGDADRQAATVIRQNSENAINSVPRISVYVYGLSLDRDRLSDRTFTNKLHIEEREIQGTKYTSNRGRKYTVERLMPTPFLLTMKVDIWTANTDQKLQLMEQLLMMFNPSVEIQSNDNIIDWTSLSVLNLKEVNWSSRQVPTGTESQIDIATLTVEAPIWISPPAKVRQLGIITKIITGLYEADTSVIDYNYGTLEPLDAMGSLLAETITVATNNNIEIYNNEITLLESYEHDFDPYTGETIGDPVKWETVLSLYPTKFVPGVSRIYVTNNNAELVGTLTFDPGDETKLIVSWDRDTLNSNVGIDSQGYFDTDPLYDAASSYRSSTGTFDAIVDPLKYNPKRPTNQESDQVIAVGTRYLLIEDTGYLGNIDGPDGWKSTSGEQLIAHANDIVEWNGNAWTVIFDAKVETDVIIWQTNTYTGIQFMWNAKDWVRSFEGVYKSGTWKLEL